MRREEGTPSQIANSAKLLAQADAEAGAGRQDTAFVLYGRVLAAEPDNPGALIGAARSLLALRRLDDSAQAWQTALALMPDNPEVLFQCGVVRFRRGAIAEAIEFFDRALEIDDGLYGALGMKVLAHLYRGDSSDALWRAQTAWAAQREPSPLIAHSRNGDDPDRRLRIGYLSSDFRAHSVGLNMLPVFRRLDRESFQIYAYAHVAHPDAATKMFEDACDGWRSIVGLDDAEVAQAVIADGIDILVILAGHLDENRPFVARCRPAPILVSHHDICTSALPEIDYFLGDPFVTPPGGKERFSERVVRLPTFTVHSIPAEAAAPGPLPALSNGYIRFGSFNAPQKISDTCLASWAAILSAVPNSRLLLKHFEAYSEAATRGRIFAGLSAYGVDPERVELLATAELRSEHLRAYNRVDIALDPFPFSGATTTFEALLMGVPVISLIADRFVGRCSAATLAAAGLSVCVADNVDNYVGRAVELASDLERLSTLRGALRPMLTQSRVCDSDRYVRNLGRVYRAMWRRWCAIPRR